MTMDNEDDRYRIKLAIHGVLDSILDAKHALPDSPHSCSGVQHALYLTNQVD